MALASPRLNARSPAAAAATACRRPPPLTVLAPAHPNPHCCHREERYYDREAVLGRDAASVFPTESRRAAVAGGEALAELLGGGNRKFISETEVWWCVWIDATGERMLNLSTVGLVVHAYIPFCSSRKSRPLAAG